MEDFVLQLVQTGNATAILAGAAVYLIIFLQRKNTSVKRNNERDELFEKIDELNDTISALETEKQLMQKDIKYLLSENDGVKADIKEMKATLQTMALALERIAAKYDN